MAATRIMSLHIGKGRTVGKSIQDIIDYVENPDKTDGGRLISSYQCDSRIANAEFLFAKRQYLAKTGRKRGADMADAPYPPGCSVTYGQGRVLFAGEIAGFLNPMGEGISAGMESGYCVAQAIANHFDALNMIYTGYHWTCFITPGWSGLWNLCTGCWMSILVRTFAASRIEMFRKASISSGNLPYPLSNHLKCELPPNVPFPTSCLTAFLSLTLLSLFGVKIDFRG